MCAMRIDDQAWLLIADAFNEAAFTGDWLEALSGLARITGSMAGQMIGFGSADALAFNLVTEFGNNYMADFVAMGGNDININPFLRAATVAPVLKTLSSVDFMTKKERLTNSFLAEHTRRYGAADLSLVKLIEEPDLVVGLSVIQSVNQGPLDARRKRLFSSLVPHVRAAVRTRVALENQGAAIMTGALEALSLTAFLCDRRGAVKAMTPSAEALLEQGSLLKIKQGLLGSSIAAETRHLTDAIAKAIGGVSTAGLPASSTVVLHDQSAQPTALQIFPLPHQHFNFGFDPRVLILISGSQLRRDHMRQLLHLLYELTSAEIDVALRLLDGQSPEQVAVERKAAIGTVRAQIRSIYEKLGVNHFYEFLAQINRLR
jgi:DNA-binding CsgD family transcriptional regulator